MSFYVPLAESTSWKDFTFVLPAGMLFVPFDVFKLIFICI